MAKELVMGNEAIGFGAIYAGVGVVTGYPGTPSTEILETIAAHNPGDIYVEWSVNEKAALEVAAGAAFSGERALVTMKQVGLNVASDPLMSLNYIGVKGGLVVVVADDPGPISSQTEQDTRHFAEYAKLMVFDPSSPKEAYEMIADAFLYSEKYGVPVLFRPTTRVCHSYQTITLKERLVKKTPEGFVKDSTRWVIFPKLAYENHKKLVERMEQVAEEFSGYRFNILTGKGKKGIITSGISYEYVKEVVGDREDIKVLKVATVNPYPEKLVVEFLEGVGEVLAVEELDPVLETMVTYVCGKYQLPVKVYGKLTNSLPRAGENSVELIENAIEQFLGEHIGKESKEEVAVSANLPPLPMRPPVLCAGCPHRASFYVVKKAMKGKRANFCGDIGCYTLGNAKPLDMVDTCLCMGADLTIAQGLYHVDQEAIQFAFIGDSTFFASGITGVINAVYNEVDVVLALLDNSTTAMTGQQPHPGTGITMMGNITDKIQIELLLKAIGVKRVITVNPFYTQEAINVVEEVARERGVRVILFKSPCIGVQKSFKKCEIHRTTCVNCKRCISELGCPAIVVREGLVTIEKDLCNGCGLCQSVCPTKAIGGRNHE